jgi:hypothetical protein
MHWRSKQGLPHYRPSSESKVRPAYLKLVILSEAENPCISSLRLLASY